MAVVGLLDDGAGGVITITMSVENAARVSKSLTDTQAAIIPTMAKTARRGVWLYVVPRTRSRIAQESGIGQAIWGRDISGMEKQGLVKQGKLLMWLKSGQTSLLLRGIPGLLEEGGRIKPHIIKHPFGHKEGYATRRGGGWIAGMRHPGMTLRPHHFGRETLGAGVGKIGIDINTALAEMLRRRGF